MPYDIYGLYYVEVHPQYPLCLKFFNYKWMSNFVKRFFCICWNGHMLFLLQLVNDVYHIAWFDSSHRLHHSSIPELNPTWSWCIILLMYWWNQFGNILLRNFSYLEPVCCSMSSSNCCFLTCIQISQEADQVVVISKLTECFLWSYCTWLQICWSDGCSYSFPPR